MWYENWQERNSLQAFLNKNAVDSKIKDPNNDSVGVNFVILDLCNKFLQDTTPQGNSNMQ